MSKTVSYAQWSLEPYCIGLKLRSLRTQKRLTLSRLAAETGLSTALLVKAGDRPHDSHPAHAGHHQPCVWSGDELLLLRAGPPHALDHAQGAL
jgi:hypothetical protein